MPMETWQQPLAQVRQLVSGLNSDTGTGAYVRANSPAFTGTPTAPTAGAGTNTTQLATTAFVLAAIAAVAPTVWTPADASGAALVLTFSHNYYIKIGTLVLATASITYPATADASNALIGGLPFTINVNLLGAGIIGFTSFASGGFAANPNNGATTSGFYLNGTQQTNANMSGRTFNVSFLYST